MKRCAWASREPLITYHDEEWGTPQHDDRVLFEFLVLEGAQAGLSWDTILNKRAGYRRAFARFDPRKVAGFGARDVARLMADPGIVRNRAKIASAIANAKAFLAVVKEHGTFDAYVWSFTDPTALSRDLRRRGFNFVGPTIMEAFMEAVGMLDHHDPECDRGRHLRKARRPPGEAGAARGGRETGGGASGEGLVRSRGRRRDAPRPPRR